jgi:hypothetical protein
MVAVMDIEKDSNREAFESWFESRYDANFAVCA